MIYMVAGLLIYCMLGALAIHLWQRLWQRRHGIIVYKVQENPVRWLAYGLPLVITGEVYLLTGAGLFSTLFAPFLIGDTRDVFRHTLIGFVIVFAAISISFDIWMVVLSRRELRRQRREPAER